MKILLLSPKYPPFGGIRIHVKSLAKWLSEHGYKVTVCMPGSETISATEESKNLTIYRMSGLLQKIPILFKNSNRLAPLPIPDPIFIKKISKVIKNEKPDIIHAHGRMLFSAITLKKKFDIPVIATIHDYGFICPTSVLMRGDVICNKCFTKGCVHCGKERLGLTMLLLHYLGIKSQKKNLKYVDKFIAVSSLVKDVHSKYIDRDRIDVIPNFYNANEKDVMISKESNMLPDDFILFVGSLTRYKGADVLIDAFDMIEDKNVKLVMYVQKKPKGSYKASANILIFEDASRDLILEAYSRCRFVVIPSTIPEACPTVAFEAMSYKKAIIASNIGGLTDIVNNRSTGILVSPNNIKELVDAINILIENPDMTLRMGMAGYNEFISNYTSEIVLPNVQAIYESIKKG